MCVGDWRLGRLIRIQQTNWNTTGSVALSLAANPQRVGVMCALRQNPVQTISISTSGFNGLVDYTESGALTPNFAVTMTVDSKALCVLTPYNPMQFMTLATHGDISTRAMGITLLGSTNAVGTWTEFFLPEDVLRTALESLRSEYKI